jgi:hypothetical protein
MEQARIMQAIISRGLLPPQAQTAQHPELQTHKEITITQNSLIEVSSDDESDSDSESESSDTESGSGSDTESESDKWSIGDEIHQPDSLHESFNELSQKKHIHIDTVDGSGVEQLEIETLDCKHAEDSTKKIISLKSALNDEDEDDESEDDDADDSSSVSSESKEKPQDFEVKIGYKSASASASAAKVATAVHLNYGNMSVPALRQLAKERGLGGDEGDLQKLKKKELVQLLQ